MTLPPDLRRSRILEWLTEHHSLTIDDLADRLSVSVMTVHRDLDWLAERRRVVKVHGAVLRAVDDPAPSHSGPRCALCERAVPHRTAFKIRAADGQTLHACCPHCGLLLLSEHANASALTRDFLYGRMVNVRQAAYLFDSSVSACCVPSVLCFATEDDARRFQTGFGGQTRSFAEAVEHLLQHHHGEHHC